MSGFILLQKNMVCTIGFSRKLRYELPEDEQDSIIATIRNYRKGEYIR